MELPSFKSLYRRQLGDWGTFNPYNAPIVYDEFSVFGDLTYHVTDRFDVQIGGRESRLKNTVNPATVTDLLATVIDGSPTTPYSFPGTTLNENDAFTYLLTPRFKISSDFMVYARLASGYRPGGINAGTPQCLRSYSADKSKTTRLAPRPSSSITPCPSMDRCITSTGRTSNSH